MSGRPENQGRPGGQRLQDGQERPGWPKDAP